MRIELTDKITKAIVFYRKQIVDFVGTGREFDGQIGVLARKILKIILSDAEFHS